jgi:hypothetical protein
MNVALSVAVTGNMRSAAKSIMNGKTSSPKKTAMKLRSRGAETLSWLEKGMLENQNIPPKPKNKKSHNLLTGDKMTRNLRQIDEQAALQIAVTNLLPIFTFCSFI